MHPSLPETHPRYPFENLCFEGGGVKGVAYCGALRVLEEEGVYPHHVRRVAGTSIGSLFAMLLALGYSSAELVELLRKTDLSQVLQDRRFGWLGAAWNMFRTFGLNPGSRLADFIGQCLVSHGGTADLTFRQLYEQSGRELCVPVCNVTRLETEYCHPKTTPELPVRVAVAMSMALPVLMRPHRITRSFRDSTSSWKEEELYTDGGLLCNFPVHAFDGWWLSMAPEDTFLARLRPSSEAARLTQDAVRFSPPSGATLAFTTFSDLDRDHSSAWAREGGGPPPRPDTALARAQAKLESQNQRRLARSGELERAFGQLTDTLAGLDGDGDGHISRHEVQALFDQGTLSPADAVLLFGTRDVQRIFDQLDENKDGRLSYSELVRFMDSHNIELTARVATQRRSRTGNVREFLGNILEALHSHVHLSALRSDDRQRTIPISTGYIRTSDFGLTDADRGFLFESGARATRAFFRDWNARQRQD
jgi:predicted acylesterase/phospholipase RssA